MLTDRKQAQRDQSTRQTGGQRRAGSHDCWPEKSRRNPRQLLVRRELSRPSLLFLSALPRRSQASPPRCLSPAPARPVGAFASVQIVGAQGAVRAPVGQRIAHRVASVIPPLRCRRSRKRSPCCPSPCLSSCARCWIGRCGCCCPNVCFKFALLYPAFPSLGLAAMFLSDSFKSVRHPPLAAWRLELYALGLSHTFYLCQQPVERP